MVCPTYLRLESLTRPILGGNWNNAAVCGSRSSNWNNRALNLNANYGARAASETRVIPIEYCRCLTQRLDFQATALCRNTRQGKTSKLVKIFESFGGFIIKRHGKLFDKIADPENIKIAYAKARKGKLWQNNIKKILRNEDYYLDCVRQMLTEGTYRTSSYREKIIHEPKMRTIYILPFYPDRIVQHTIMNIVAPLWDKMFINDSYACRAGKGQHIGSKRCMQFVKRNKYVLQCDVSKFYPSINHGVLKEIIHHKIKCRRTLALMDEIIDSIPGESNVPIGNYTSQWFGNLYLNELDQLLKNKYKVRDYIRYCDDFLLFGNDKDELNRLKGIITDFTRDRLKLKLSKSSLYPTSQGVDFLGYRHFPSGKILLRKTTAKRMKRKLRTLSKQVHKNRVNLKEALSVVVSIRGWMKWANTHHLRLSCQLDELEVLIREEIQRLR